MVSPCFFNNSCPSPARSTIHAGDLVVRALQAEVAGKNQERIKLLQEAVTVSPEYAPARWHLGQIQQGGVWKSAEEIAISALNDPRLSRYIELRAGLGDAEKRCARSIWLDPPNEKAWCHLRKTFDLPAKPHSAELHIWTRSPYVIFINGKRLAGGKPVEPVVELSVLNDLQAGSNTIALQVKAGPPSVLVWLRGAMDDGSTFSVPSDTSWKATTSDEKNWTATSFDDRNWPSPVEYVRDSPPDNVLAAAQAEDRKNALISTMRTLQQESLARWCGDQQLEPQSRIHWGHLLLAVPKHRAAIKSLGLTRVGDELLTKEQIDVRKEHDMARIASLTRWGPVLKTALRKLKSKSTSIVDEGRKSIEVIVEPDAIPAFRSLLVTQKRKTNATFAIACIEALRHIDDPMVPEVIVEAVYHHPEYPVALAASKALAKSELTSFVPAIMARLEAQSQFTCEVDQLDQMTSWAEWRATKVPSKKEKDKDKEDAKNETIEGEVMTKVAIHRFRTLLIKPRPFGEFREEKTHVLQFRHERKLQYPITDNDRALAEASVSDDVSNWVRRLNVAISIPNVEIQWHNQGLEWLLEHVTGQSFHMNAIPEPWWRWWKKYNGLENVGPPTFQKLSWWDRFLNSEEMRLSPDYPRECFANGTPVWTQRGMAPIETILAGDEVLSQDPQTGALEYKVVLGTSTRTPTSLVRLKVGRDTVIATPRHRFWLPGQGWRTINQIAKGEALHSLNGPLLVSETGANDEAPTCSLVVEDSHTFFVGREKILVHDSGLPQRTDRIVPGLSGAAMAK